MAGLWTLYGRQWTLYGRRWGLYLTAETETVRQPGGFIPARPVRPIIYVKDKPEVEPEQVQPVEIEAANTTDPPEKPRIDVNPAVVAEVISAEMAELHQSALALRDKVEEDQRNDDALAILLLLAA